MQGNLDKYSNILKLQKGYEATYTSKGKYTIVGGQRPTQDDTDKDHGYDQNLAEMRDYDIARTLRLGYVDKYNW